MGIARAAESAIKDLRGLNAGQTLRTEDKLVASALG